MIGFLKKLPQLPIILGSGNLLFLISMTELEISLIVGSVIFLFIMCFFRGSYDKLIL